MEWEYMVINRENTGVTELQIELDSLGVNGWELVAIRGDEFYFKRPL